MTAPEGSRSLYWSDVSKQCSIKARPASSDGPHQDFLMPRTKQRTPELRERVLATAVDLLAEEGAAGLTARSLAARAETSAPALYELFGDKSGVVRELYFEGFRQLLGELSALGESADPIADLWALATAYRRFIR